MYKEGRQFVVDTKKEIDGVIKDVKSVQRDAKGIVGFFRKLFGDQEIPQAKIGQDTPKTKQKKVEFDENQIYAQVADALTKFFHAYNGLQTYKMEQEASALTVGDEEGQDIAVKLVIANLQMERLNEEMREYMVYHVPQEMKDLYSRVNDMIGHIANKQQIARKAELDKKRAIAWQRRQVINKLQNRVLVGIATSLVILWTWLMILTMIPSTSL
jgi:uncharacterized membrane protein